MNIEELKAKVESHCAALKEKDGHICHFSETGPVGMGLIDALVSAVEAQERRIATIERLIQS